MQANGPMPTLDQLANKQARRASTRSESSASVSARSSESTREEAEEDILSYRRLRSNSNRLDYLRTSELEPAISTPGDKEKGSEPTPKATVEQPAAKQGAEAATKTEGPTTPRSRANSFFRIG